MRKPRKNQFAKQEPFVRMALVRAELYAEMPRLYKTFDYVDMIMTDEVPTLAVAPIFSNHKLTGRYKFFWNPEYTKTLSDNQLKGVLIHEILHILYSHTTTRYPDIKINWKDSGNDREIKDKHEAVKHQAWNISTDYAINSLIRDYLTDGPEVVGIFPEQSNLMVGQTSEYYYQKVLDKAQKQQAELDKLLDELKKEMENASGDHGQWVEADEKGNVSPNSAQGKAGGDQEAKVEAGQSTDQESKEEIEKELQEIGIDLGIGSQGGQKAGSSNQTSKQVVLTAGKAKKLPKWMQKTTSSSVHGYEMLPQITRKVPNRRYGLAFPGKRRIQSSNKVLVAIDVSGSISMTLLQKFMEHCLHMERFASFDVVFFNHSLIKVNKVGKQEAYAHPEECILPYKKGMQFPIGGGTSFEPVVQLWNSIRRKYDALFIFTDGEADYITEPVRPKEVNWILYGSPYSTLKGHCYRMDKDSDSYEHLVISALALGSENWTA